MKKKLLPLLLAAAMLVTTAAATQTQQQTLTATYGVQLVVDGQARTLTDANGTVVRPFVSNGTTYVPIRAIAELFGAEVSYDRNSNTATIQSGSGADVYTYTDFTVPSFATIAGSNSLVDTYLVSTGDSVAYYFDPQKFTPIPNGTNTLDDYEVLYGSLLSSYGFHYAFTDSEGYTYYEHPISGIAVSFGMVDSLFMVVVMSPTVYLSTGTGSPSASTGNSSSGSSSANLLDQYYAEYDAINAEYDQLVQQLQSQKNSYQQSQFQSWMSRGLSSNDALNQAKSDANQKYDPQIAQAEQDRQLELSQLDIKYGIY